MQIIFGVLGEYHGFTEKMVLEDYEVEVFWWKKYCSFKKNIVFFYRTQDHSIVQSVVFWSFGNSTQDIFFINHDFACR
jgi:hypothetical protein